MEGQGYKSALHRMHLFLQPLGLKACCHGNLLCQQGYLSVVVDVQSEHVPFLRWEGRRDEERERFRGDVERERLKEGRREGRLREGHREGEIEGGMERGRD